MAGRCVFSDRLSGGGCWHPEWPSKYGGLTARGLLSALGIDSDAVAIDRARDYPVVNGFTAELELQACRIDELATQSFEIIVANIDRNTILEILPEFSRFRSSATQLFLSGLLVEDGSDIAERFTFSG